MKNLKKLIAVVLTFALVFSAMAVGFAATTPFTDVKDDAPYASAVARLYALNITNGNTDGTYGVDQPVTRAMMTVFVNRLSGYRNLAEMAKNDAPAFKDVSKNYWAIGDINLAAKLGLTHGVGNGMFAPEEKVTYAQALGFMLNALGYKNLSWPYGVVAKAQDLGLTVGINRGYNDVVTRGDLALIMDKALDQQIVTSYDTNGNPVLGNKLISKVADVTRYLVVATPDVDSNIAQGKVLVQGIKDVNSDGVITFKAATTINAGTVDFNKYLGKVVDVYSIKGGDPVSVDVVSTDKTFTAKSFEVVSNSVYNDGSKVVDIDTPANVTVIYNSGKTTLDQVATKVYDGANVVLTDTNNDGKYDYAVITGAYKASVVVTADVKAGDKFLNVNGVSNSSYRIAGDPVKTVVVTGSVDKLTDIKNGDVVYYASTVDGTKITLFVVRDKVEGKITKVAYDGSTTTATIGGKDYTVTQYINGNTSGAKATVGQEGTFVLDKDGNIVGFIGKQAVANYAVLIVKDDASKLNTKVKLLTADGKVNVYSAVYDTVANTTYQEGDIITYTIDSNNVVTAINSPKTADTDNVVTTITDPAAYNKDTHVLTVSGTPYYMTDNTVIFNYNSTDDIYSTVKLSDITKETLNVKQLVADQYGYVKAIYLNESSLTADQGVASTVYGYVAGVTTIDLGSGNTQYKLNVLVNGSEQVYTTKVKLTPVPSTGAAVIGLDSNNVVVSFATKTVDVPGAKVDSYTAYGITLQDGTSYALSPNVTVVKTVYKTDGTTVDHYELAQLGDLAQGTTVDLYKDSTGRIAVIVIK
ncbi:S-layer homology domain-containing protein [Thermoanaerobacter wiegelii]|uniref:S-layer domain-containing protein n=1 Tax=Thermoanaerobacter wiegelii Rt8.B1 TaxID=697303 RepID=G2MU87_9THEO|nr:S-layer homology domain-containing protein [Thermoanaerobacter wiegelii]AEM79914.1 S-layer domain-containing protein [Thermoanaerobacter wiegelii Rt8.B1]